jgi:hypothetical protein
MQTPMICKKIKNACGVNDTACKIWHRMHDRRTIRAALAGFKGNIYVPELYYHKHYKNIGIKRGYITTKFRACDVIDTACTIFAIENPSYLGEFKAEFKKALARESGAQGALFDEKTEGRKSRDTVPVINFVKCVKYRTVSLIVRFVIFPPTHIAEVRVELISAI